jgi:hypothetical protein
LRHNKYQFARKFRIQPTVSINFHRFSLVPLADSEEKREIHTYLTASSEVMLHWTSHESYNQYFSILFSTFVFPHWLKGWRWWTSMKSVSLYHWDGSDDKRPVVNSISNCGNSQIANFFRSILASSKNRNYYKEKKVICSGKLLWNLIHFFSKPVVTLP